MKFYGLGFRNIYRLQERNEIVMIRAIWYGFLSAAAGIIGCFLLEGFGIVFSISVATIGIISTLEKKKQ